MPALKPADALVLFGATGDLAHKQIWPALHAMAKRGALTVPVVGVAFSPAGTLSPTLPRNSFGVSLSRARSALMSLGSSFTPS